WVLLRRTTPARWPDDQAQGPLDGWADPAICRGDPGARATGKTARIHEASQVVPQLPPGLGQLGFALGGAGPRRAAVAIAPARPSHGKAPPKNVGRGGVPFPGRRAGPLQNP